MKMSLLNVKFESNNNVCLFISMYTLIPFYIYVLTMPQDMEFLNHTQLLSQGYFEGINTSSLQIGGTLAVV